MKPIDVIKMTQWVSKLVWACWASSDPMGKHMANVLVTAMADTNNVTSDRLYEMATWVARKLIGAE